MDIRRYSLVLAFVALAGLAISVGTASAQSTNDLPHAATIPTSVPSPVLPVVPTVAPGYSAPHVAPTGAQIIGVTQQPFVGLTLQDAVGMALLKNPNLAISASNMKVARYQVIEAKGPFDLKFQVEPSSSFSVQPPENAFFAGPGSRTHVPDPVASTLPLSNPYVNNPGNIIQNQTGFQYGLSGETVSGTQYQAGIQQQRTYNNITFNAYNPSYLASLNLGVTQPLLRDLGWNTPKRQLKVAVINADSDAAQTLVDASSTISQVEDTYWDLVAAWRNVAIQEDALNEATRQQQSNVRLAQKGAAAPIDAVESSTQVANFQDNVFSALQTVSELQNALKGMIVTDPGDPVWMANLVPTSPVQEIPAPSDLATVVAVANQNRPEVRQAADKELEASIERAYAKNQGLPQANVQATYESNGFAGLALPLPSTLSLLACQQSGPPSQGGTGKLYCPQVPGNTIGTMAYAYHNLWTGLFPTFNIDLAVSYPMQNSLAKGLKGVAGEEQRQADVLTMGTQEKIGAEARNALQAYESAVSRLSSARVARESADQVFASELRRFHNGLSTTFLVLQRQVQLDEARGRELQAQTALNKSIVELERVKGTILTTNGVDLRTLGTQAVAAPGAH